MTTDTVVQVFGTNFLTVLGLYIGRRVLVAAVAGVLLVVVTGMAGHARRIVVLVKYEELVMLKSGRLPGLRLVALRAVAGHLCM